MQRFSWQTRTICATGANVECQSNKLLVGGGGVGAWSPSKFIGLSKMQFPAFSGSALVNQDGILRH